MSGRKLSIIVPVYNMASEGKLEYCLNSLVGQTLCDYEIIAVDDASQDESPRILKRYEEAYPDRFRAVLCRENRRQGGAKNTGLSLAQGEWIGFIDSDDWIAPDMYEKLLKKAEETGADMVGCDYHLTWEHSMKIGQVVANGSADQCGPLTEEKYRRLILDSGSLVVKIYRREIFLDNEIRFPEGIFYEDNAISDAVMLHAKHYEYIPEPLYYYYQHGTSTVHTITRERCEDRMEAGRGILREAKRFGYLEQYRPEICFEFTVLFYVNTLFSYMVGKGFRSRKFVKRMGDEMRAAFPEFMENPYYQQRVHAEEKKLIAIQQKSTTAFLLYYKLLWTWRNFRRKLHL
ncbi:MAG TPA: glycosyltransferase [Candidatus Eisenbergiella merdigallinarum]|uniref:Glycosyltransferase n=1 Tax=Candidatus Eisenbergiella merdigallinarum TaxID=2838552 RepID=A0A9D2SCL2_9FIRM|nr:glycosyltransferase [Candidatus Eisenbergiella merdigallinarum]